MIGNIIAILIASFGFGILFNIRGKNLVAAAIAGAWGCLIYQLALYGHLGEIFSLFLAACGISLYCEILARKLKTPVTSFVICALIPLVPGGGMYYTMMEIINGNTMKAIETGLNTLGCAGALALGIALFSAICPIIMKTR